MEHKRFSILKCILPVNVFLLFTAFYFPSMEVFISNCGEFGLAVNHVWWIMLVFMIFLILILTLIEFLLPQKLIRYLNIILFAVGFCCYLQGLFLNNGLIKSFTGETIVFSKKETFFNVIIWITIISFLIFLFLKYDEKGNAIIVWIAVSLFFIQSVGLLSKIASQTTIKSSTYFSNEAQFELGKENNVIVVIVDALDNRFIESSIKEYPELLNDLKGFTYYNNTTSKFGRTIPSLMQLLTGQEFYYEIPYRQFIADAWEKSCFIQDLEKNGVNIRLYTEDYLSSQSILGRVDNCKEVDSTSLQIIKPVPLVKLMIHLAGYRVAPLIFKDRFVYYSNAFKDLAMDYPKDIAINNDCARFYHVLETNGLSLSEETNCAFTLYHLSGTHIGANINERLEKDLAASVEEVVSANFIVVDKLLEELRNLDIYDSSTIIITADHGCHEETADGYLNATDTPAIFVKTAYSDSNQSVQASNMPVNLINLQATILNGFGIASDDYETAAENVKKDDYPVRSFFYRGNDRVLTEYQIEDSSSDFNNWTALKQWEIKYRSLA